MALSTNQQIFELVNKNKSILIIFKKDWTGDALASSLALANVLKKYDKKIDIVCQNFKTPQSLSYLPTDQIIGGLSNLQKFVISVDTTKTQVGEFFYDTDEKKLNIYLTPKEGQFGHEDITTAISDFKYDIIFVINSPDLESLGASYNDNSDFFYSTPKINIDNSPQNEYFGNIDVVNLAANSTAEIVYDLIKEFDEKLIDEDIATYLLTGIITATKNFKTQNITPKTLNLASLLVAKGARREQIIQNLYQNRYLSTLKLWGRVLSRLNNDLDDKLVWSSLSVQDFLETATTPADIVDVVDELIVSMPKTEIIVLLYEIKNGSENSIKIIIYSIKNIDSLFIAQKFNPEGNKEVAKFTLAGVTLADAERAVIDEIKNKLK
ncbi:MAG TPA: hypothetical protein VJB67_01805 [Patescibacteria group bacterium]|nr:hypothetical protein [Patescibacteria group bacterium]